MSIRGILQTNGINRTSGNGSCVRNLVTPVSTYRPSPDTCCLDTLVSSCCKKQVAQCPHMFSEMCNKQVSQRHVGSVETYTALFLPTCMCSVFFFKYHFPQENELPLIYGKGA